MVITEQISSTQTVKVTVIDRHYTVAESASLLSVGVDWIYERIRDGRLTVIELGDERKNQRIAATVLQKFIDLRTFGTR
jgi:excisionase family DNA binding protein